MTDISSENLTFEVARMALNRLTPTSSKIEIAKAEKAVIENLSRRRGGMNGSTVKVRAIVHSVAAALKEPIKQRKFSREIQDLFAQHESYKSKTRSAERQFVPPVHISVRTPEDVMSALRYLCENENPTSNLFELVTDARRVVRGQPAIFGWQGKSIEKIYQTPEGKKLVQTVVASRNGRSTTIVGHKVGIPLFNRKKKGFQLYRVRRPLQSKP